MKRLTILVLLFALLTACVTGPPPSTRTAEASRTLTSVPATVTSTQVATATATAALTIEPCTQATPPPECWTALPPLTDTPTAPSTPTRIPQPTSTPVNFIGLLNGSFEGAVYTRADNTSSLFPLYWDFWWAEGEGYLKPEILPKHYLSMGEGRDLVPDGDWSLKLFKGWGPLWIIMGQRLELAPGNYSVGCAIYPDQVISYDGGKTYPSPGSSADWYLGSQVNMYTDFGAIPPSKDARDVPYGKWTRVTHAFTLSQVRQVQIELDLKGPWGFTNNGWFVDDCQLSRQGSTTPSATAVATTVGLTSPWMAYHTVGAGDTLGKIAIRYGTTVDNIVSANALRYPTLLTDPSHVEVSWVLNVPCVTCVNNWGCCPATTVP